MGTIKTKIENRMANKYGLKVAVEIEENGEAIYIARAHDNGGEEIIADIGMDGSYAYFVEGFERLTTSQTTLKRIHQLKQDADAERGCRDEDKV